MIVEENTAIDTSDKIQRLIYVVRGRQVLTDSDLAVLYQVETGNLNKAMKRAVRKYFLTGRYLMRSVC